jgi:hypothetical protein
MIVSKELLQKQVEVFELHGNHLQMLLKRAVDRFADPVRERLNPAANPGS